MSEPEKDIACNMCGLSCFLGPKGSPARGPHGLIDAHVIGGYESTPGNGDGALDDFVRHRFSLCEFCLDWMFSQFVVPVTVDDPMNEQLPLEGESLEDAMVRLDGFVQLVKREEPEAWEPAAKRVAKDEWRKTKDKFFAEAALRTASRKPT
jgi:hypothetical protein